MNFHIETYSNNLIIWSSWDSRNDFAVRPLDSTVKSRSQKVPQKPTATKGEQYSQCKIHQVTLKRCHHRRTWLHLDFHAFMQAKHKNLLAGSVLFLKVRIRNLTCIGKVAKTGQSAKISNPISREKNRSHTWCDTSFKKLLSAQNIEFRSISKTLHLSQTF